MTEGERALKGKKKENGVYMAEGYRRYHLFRRLRLNGLLETTTSSWNVPLEGWDWLGTHAPLCQSIAPPIRHSSTEATSRVASCNIDTPIHIADLGVILLLTSCSTSICLRVYIYMDARICAAFPEIFDWRDFRESFKRRWRIKKMASFELVGNKDSSN